MAKDAPENELCFYSSCSGKSLLNSDVLFNTFPRKKPGAKDDSSCHLNLIYFCGAVQALGLDFLPIYWQPQNGLIGGGGTSRVHQSLLNLELSLAFKAIDVGDISRARTGDDVERIYSLLLAEIQHMGWKPILNSPYIHKVEGVCWSLNKSTGVADPVLVFEKAPHGDMYHYMTCGKGKSLDLSDRLRMCRDVAIGLDTLHDCSKFFQCSQIRTMSVQCRTRYHSWRHQASECAADGLRWLDRSTGDRFWILDSIHEFRLSNYSLPHSAMECP
jgi:hypothetical protein